MSSALKKEQTSIGAVFWAVGWVEGVFVDDGEGDDCPQPVKIREANASVEKPWRSVEKRRDFMGLFLEVELLLQNRGKPSSAQ